MSEPKLTPAPTANRWQESRFVLPGMDCPAEEQAIRFRLDGVAEIEHLRFDLPARELRIVHCGPASAILQRLIPLGFGARLQESTELGAEQRSALGAEETDDDALQRRVLWWLLGINATMFFVEGVAGWWARSTGLMADAVDMFADAAVYGLALFAVGHSATRKLRAAHLAGYLQLLLAFGVLFEVVRRTWFGAEPFGLGMIGVASLALVANVICLALITRHRDGGAHMQASYIFSANDVIANAGVIFAGVLVMWLQSPWPDLAIGTLIAFVVFRGAVRILRLR